MTEFHAHFLTDPPKMVYRSTEASVEYITEQVCKERKIPFIPTYTKETEALHTAYMLFEWEGLYSSELEFAKDLFEVPLPERYQWLESKADDILRKYKASFEEYNEIMVPIGGLEGGYGKREKL